MENEFQLALDEAKIKITKYDSTKTKSPITTTTGSYSVEKFISQMELKLKQNISKYPEVHKACFDPYLMADLLENYASSLKMLGSDKSINILEKYSKLTLNLDESHRGKDLQFFMTTQAEYISEVSGSVYLKACEIPEPIAVSMARKVVPAYLPYNPPGVFDIPNLQEENISYFNKYIPPPWKREMASLSFDVVALPPLFSRLVEHLFPIKEEREFFYSWLYCSLFERSYTYLVLSGAPGVGKNVLKKVMKALHGAQNTTDGKKSSLTERFNSQFTEATLCWFDELKYDVDMENVLKELQNDTISIEKKGVDATKSSEIYASFVISNNKPRDNYIAFDARKFVPLELTSKRLEESLSPAEIDQLTKKVENPKLETYDSDFLKQIGMWLKRKGKNPKWPNLEYKGPMFYKLCHTSMTVWQKKVSSYLLNLSPRDKKTIPFVEGKGYLWSDVEKKISSKEGSGKRINLPEYSTVLNFFEMFVGSKGEKAFRTCIIKDDLQGDFYVDIISKTKIILEQDLIPQAEDLL